MVFFEIPTGFISDKYSRKASIIIGLLLSCIAFFTMGLSQGFRGFDLSEFLLAIGYTCISGSDTALLYDTLALSNHTDQYKSKSGMLSGICSFAEALGAIVGAGIAAQYALNIPLFMDSAFAGIALLLSVFLHEVPRSKLEAQEGSRSQLKDIIIYTRHHRQIYRLLWYGALLGSLTLCMVRLSQPFMDYIYFPVAYFGIYRAVSNISVGIFGILAHKLEEILGLEKFPYVLVGLAIMLLIVVAIRPISRMIIVFLLFAIVRTGVKVVSNDTLHLICEPKYRATMQSISSMLFRLCFGVVGPIVGYISHAYSLSSAFIFLAITLGTASFWTIGKFQRA